MDSTHCTIDTESSYYLTGCAEWLVREESKLEMRRIPALPQKYFILLWKTLYSLTVNTEDQAVSQEQQVRRHQAHFIQTQFSGVWISSWKTYFPPLPQMIKYFCLPQYANFTPRPLFSSLCFPLLYIFTPSLNFSSIFLFLFCFTLFFSFFPPSPWPQMASAVVPVGGGGGVIVLVRWRWGHPRAVRVAMRQ